jgi:Outer membrane protein
MKKITLLCTFVALGFAAFTSIAKADEAKLSPAVIAIVDMQKLQDESTAYKGLVKQRDKYVAELKAEVSKEETSLRKMEQDINKERSILTQEELNKKIEAFRTKMMEFQQKVQAKQEAIYKSFMEAGLKIQNEALNPAVAEIAEKKGANMITGSSQMMQFAPEFDITEEVIKLMNKKLPKVTMAKPNAEASKK